MWNEAAAHPTLVPTVIPNLAGVVQLAPGGYRSCAVMADGTVRCAENGSGISQVVEIASGGWHACARRVDESVWCWGMNNAGQVGDGTTITRASPGRVFP